MSAQAIVYGPDGKVRYVVDPQGTFNFAADTSQLAAQVGLPANHGVLLYETRREELRKIGSHEFYDWQAAVDKHLGKS